MLWSDVVDSMSSGFDTVMYWVTKLLSWFNSPFSEIINTDVGVTSWITSLIDDILGLFGLDFMDLTPLDFALGSVIPVVIVFTIFRYVKQ